MDKIMKMTKMKKKNQSFEQNAHAGVRKAFWQN